MTRDTENIFREFQEFIEGKEFNTEEEVQQAMDEFMNMKNNNTTEKGDYDAWDYLDMAYNAENEEDAVKYAKKALKLDKTCLDAEVLIADLTIYDAEKLKSKYEALIKKTEKRLKQKDYFNEEDIGHFWGIVETRSYMRLRNSYSQLLTTMGKFRKAITECEDLLTLSENDNLGIRYRLVSLYAMFEDELNALKLYKKYEEDSTAMLLPIVFMYYKLDNNKKAETYLKKLNESNDELLDFFENMDMYDEDEIREIIYSGTYSPGSKEEIILALWDNVYLYSTSETFFIWMVQKLSIMQ